MNSRRQRGTVTTWNDGKGFGFIAPESETGDVFLHISALPAEIPRPAVGDVVTYVTGTDEKGRLRAVQARLEGARTSPSKARINAICFATAFLAALAQDQPLSSCLSAATHVASRAISTLPRNYGGPMQFEDAVHERA